MSEQNEEAAREEAARKIRELGKRLRFAHEHSDELNLSPKVKAALRDQFGKQTPTQNADGTYSCPTCRRHFAIKDILTITLPDLAIEEAFQEFNLEGVAKIDIRMLIASLTEEQRLILRQGIACPHCKSRLPAQFAQLVKQQA